MAEWAQKIVLFMPVWVTFAKTTAPFFVTLVFFFFIIKN